MWVMFSPQAQAQAPVDVYEFETTEQEQRFRQLSNDFRCPMCQNANLSSSPGGVAADLRREIYRMIMEGMSDEEIEAFMLQRYGDFILYRPRLTLQTVLLWFGPILFLLAGVWIARNITRSSGGRVEATDETERETAVTLSAEEKARLSRLLNDQPDADNPTNRS
ncbi:MAG: hypothetical protein CMQ46_05965 [Gammaproteobacteria bacterium]|nr:hypothetical protein [Gammaproteobacteria bacterium]MBJ54790.1 hypothetical protein [Gammaproteobacteria bacterium]HBN15962.1 hypothetical protein [Pseudohongiella sp.]